MRIYIVLLCSILAGCVTVYNPATERNEFILIDTPQEVAIGEVLDRKMSFQLKISENPEMNARLDKIGKKVAGASDRNDLIYHFKVVQDKTLNAFALPGGFIYVHSALMDKATDDELACVVAHEIGHVAAKHAVKRLQAALGYQIVISLALRNSSSVALNNAMSIMHDLITLGYSRQDEREADRLSVRYAYRSDYDPEAMISFFRKLQKEENDRYHITLLSSHPPIEERTKNIKEEIKKLEGSE